MLQSTNFIVYSVDIPKVRRTNSTMRQSGPAPDKARLVTESRGSTSPPIQCRGENTEPSPPLHQEFQSAQRNASTMPMLFAENE
jgi:hypothetical protein